MAEHCIHIAGVIGSNPIPPTKKSPPCEVIFWCVYTIPLEPILSKISEKIHSLRPAAVPQNGTASQKNFLYIFYFARAASFFLLKEKENFSARLRADARGGGSSLDARAARHSPLEPPCRAALAWPDRIFGGRGFFICLFNLFVIS